MPCCSANRFQRSSAITSIRLETERFSKEAICSSLFRCSSRTVRLSFGLFLFFYHFRIVATNGGGTTFGPDRTFTTLSATGPPVVTTNPVTNVTTSSARLKGSLDPHGLTTTVYFKWGTTTSYGHTTPTQTQTGNAYRNITANISGLTTHHTYHFRIVATNSAGTRMGSDLTFNTP